MSRATSRTSRLPDFIGVGGQRCGSTSLWRMLRADDRLFLPDRKELHYFTDRDGVYREDLMNYREWFEGAGPRQLIGEFTPNYLTSAIACERIARHIPSARIIITLRDPVDRSISLYNHRVDRGMEHRGMLRAMRADMRRCGGGGEVVGRHHAYCQLSLYSAGVERYLEAFGRDRVIVFLMDELGADTDQVRSRLGAFLGLNDSVRAPDHDAERGGGSWSNRTVSRPRSRLVQCFAKGLFRRNADPGSAFSRAKRGVARRMISLNSTQGTTRVPEGFRGELRRFFAEDTLRLEKLLDHEMPWAGDGTGR